MVDVDKLDLYYTNLLRNYGRKEYPPLDLEWEKYFKDREKESLFCYKARLKGIEREEITIEYFDKCHLLDWNILFDEIKNKRENELN